MNLWGVIHGIHIFTPIMLAQNEPGHIVNTASTAGLTSGGQLGVYGVSKHGVVRLSEALYAHLHTAGAQVGCSVLCPGGVRTQISAAGRNRPDDHLEADGHRLDSAETEQRVANWAARIGDSGQDPSETAEKVFAAINDDQFYILTHEAQDDAIRQRAQNILERRNPDVVEPTLRG